MTDGPVETTVVKDRPVNTDLSTQVEHAVQREPLDRVKCVHVFGNFYRCNWWADPGVGVASKHASIWGLVATQRVRKSRFLDATLVDGALVIKEVAAP